VYNQWRIPACKVLRLHSVLNSISSWLASYSSLLLLPKLVAMPACQTISFWFVLSCPVRAALYFGLHFTSASPPPAFLAPLSLFPEDPLETTVLGWVCLCQSLGSTCMPDHFWDSIQFRRWPARYFGHSFFWGGSGGPNDGDAWIAVFWISRVADRGLRHDFVWLMGACGRGMVKLCGSLDRAGVGGCSWYVMAEDGCFGANGGVHGHVVAVLSSREQRSSGRVRINTYR
jgi:hypothetical protein